MARDEKWQPPQLEGRDVVDADVVDEQRDGLMRRLDTWVYSRRDDGQAGNEELQAIDELEQLTRMDDPEARYRYVEQLSVLGARTLLQRLGVNADEHERRASLLSRFRQDVAQHLMTTSDGTDPAMLPTRADVGPGPARAR